MDKEEYQALRIVCICLTIAFSVVTGSCAINDYAVKKAYIDGGYTEEMQTGYSSPLMVLKTPKQP